MSELRDEWWPCRECGESRQDWVHWSDEHIETFGPGITLEETNQVIQPFERTAVMSCDSCDTVRREVIERGTR